MTSIPPHLDQSRPADLSLRIGANGRVLVVDDDVDIRAYLSAVLREAGYSVDTASDGRQALTAIEHRRPDLLLLDLAMPVMNGWEVQARLRSDGVAIPVVFMSAGHDARAEARRFHATGYLNKPFDMDDLLRVVAAFITPHREE